MFFHEVENALKDGKKVARNAWPAGDKLSQLNDSIETELDEEDQEAFGFDPDDKVEVAAGTLVYISKGKAVIGYVMTSEDRNSQDWEVVTAKKK